MTMSKVSSNLKRSVDDVSYDIMKSTHDPLVTYDLSSQRAFMHIMMLTLSRGLRLASLWRVMCNEAENSYTAV